MNKVKSILFSLLIIAALILAPKSAKADCTDPAAVAGSQIFNTTFNVMQYCNGTEWISMGSSGGAGGGIWQTNGSYIYYNGGNVGIGTDSPATAFHVVNDATIGGFLSLGGTLNVTGATTLNNTLSVGGLLTAGGAIRLANEAIVVACTAAGDMRYNTTTGNIEVCDGTEWKASSGGGFTQGSVPFADAEGKLIEDNPNLNWDNVNKDLTVGKKVSFRTESGWAAPETELIQGFPLNELDDVTISSPQLDQILKYDGSKWINGEAVSLLWQENGSDIYYNAGSIGVGTSTPTALLDVDGTLYVGDVITAGNAIRLADNATVTTCAGPQAGDIRYNSTKESIEVCSGTEWKASSAGGFTQGSVPFANVDGDLVEDNTNLSWDSANTMLTVGQKIKFKGGNGAYPSSAATVDTVLTDLTDVTITAPAADEVLAYDGSKWINQSATAASPAFTGDVSKAAGSTVTTIEPNAVALGTDTTGNYLATATAGAGISVSGTAGEGWTATITNTGDTTPDTIADDGTITLGTETTGSYDATPDTIADDGTITLGTETTGSYDATPDTIADDGTITSDEITDGTIDTIDIADGAVTLGTKTTGAYDSTPDTIADDGTITLGSETTGSYDSTPDTIADDGFIDLANEVSGVLPTANGGTGISSMPTANQVLYSDGSKMVGSSNLTWSGSILNVNGNVTLKGTEGVDYYLGDDASTETNGVVLRVKTNPASGSNLFSVQSSGYGERLSVEHDGYVRMLNSLYVSGTYDSYIANKLGIGDETPDHMLDVAGAVSATIFHDKDNVAYYLDPGNTGTSLNIAGSIVAGGSISGSGATLSGLSTAGFVTNTAAGVLGTQASIDLASDVTGALPVANGGTGTTSMPTANQFIYSDGSKIVGNPNVTWNGSETTLTAPLHINTANSIYMENGNHLISYNDGKGNFNIRVGHDAAETVTEVGYPSHMEWSQSGGTWGMYFDNDSNGLAVGGALVWDESLVFTKDGHLTTTGDMSADRFVDKNDTAYYLDPANGTSAVLAGNVGMGGTAAPLRTIHATGEVSITPNVGNGSSAFINVHDADGNNGNTYDLVLRGLKTNGTASDLLKEITLNTSTVDVKGDINIASNKSLRLWGTSDSYRIKMGNTAEFQYGPVTDYSIKTFMSNTGTRGWTWGVNGLAPKAALSINGIMQIASTMTASSFIDVNGTSYYLDPANTGTSLTVAGNVGIGTDTPTHKLQVEGESRFREKMYIGDNTANYVPTVSERNYNLQLDAETTSSIGFLDEGQSLSSIRYNNTGFMIGYDDGYGVKNTYFGGKIYTKTPPLFTSISQNTYAPIEIPEVRVAAGGGYIPFLHQRSLQPGGYRQHLVLGNYRDGNNSWGGGFFVGLGGNDAYPTEHFLLSYGGGISHSSGKIGIGTNTPNAKLELKVGSDSLSSKLLVSPGTNSKGNIVIEPLTGVNEGHSTISFNGYYASSTETQFDTSKSRRRIGVDVRSSTDIFFIDRYISGSGVPDFVIDSAGEVGIGTETPGAKLQVSNGDTSDALFGPNSTYGKYLRVGSGPYNSSITSIGQIFVTNGNVHLDAASGHNIYLNHYSGSAVYAHGSLLVSSDRRWKKDIVKIPNALNKIKQLNGVYYNWDIEKYPKFTDKNKQVGVIAQEVEKVFPEIVSSMDEEDYKGYKTVSYERLVSPIIEAIKELSGKHDDKDARIEKLENEVKELRNLINSMKE